MIKAILDETGTPYRKVQSQSSKRAELLNLQLQIRQMRSRYDAAQTNVHNENHWGATDSLDPNAANNLGVRRKLRERSRFEVIENNPYLKGVIISIANDFVGSGPTLQIVDKRINKDVRKAIQETWAAWFLETKFRQKLWRMRLAKAVDGEGIAFARRNNKLKHAVKLDYYLVETDQVSSESEGLDRSNTLNQVDGIRFNNFNEIEEYFLLNAHPGSHFLLNFLNQQSGGNWIDEKFAIHWYRQDRGWLRGIPEVTPSLPLCALLRRYTLAVVRAAELAADFAAVLETEGAPGDQEAEDVPFDEFPIGYGMFTTMPSGYKLSQLKAENPSAMFDSFVDRLLREIVRPLLVPFNIAAGTSQESNMASAIVDTHIYKSAQDQERFHCNENVLDKALGMFWQEAVLTPGLFDNGSLQRPGFVTENPSLLTMPPKHAWRWPQVGLEHTDPLKVANALVTLRKASIISDKDIQETRFNRDLEDWQEDITESEDFRKDTDIPVDPKAAADSGAGSGAAPNGDDREEEN